MFKIVLKIDDKVIAEFEKLPSLDDANQFCANTLATIVELQSGQFLILKNSYENGREVVVIPYKVLEVGIAKFAIVDCTVLYHEQQ